jgi:hypothetical protein
LVDVATDEDKRMVIVECQALCVLSLQLKVDDPVYLHEKIGIAVAYAAAVGVGIFEGQATLCLGGVGPAQGEQ